MLHLDLFSGIGGFAYAIDQVWDNVDHIFCDNDKFCKQVLKKHWPESEIYDDVRTLITNPDFIRHIHGGPEEFPAGGQHQTQRQPESGIQPSGISTDATVKGLEGEIGQELQQPKPAKRPFILTGGFPCQPFSQAGTRTGAHDDRYLWPEMFEVIKFTKPEWVVAENVSGILTWGDGLVFDKVCLDLESAGYDVQPFIIPAAGVGAPHRRDRIWFVAYASGLRDRGSSGQERRVQERELVPDQRAGNPARGQGQGRPGHATDTAPRQSRKSPEQEGRESFERGSWERNWYEVATELCRVDDGLPARLDGFELTKPQHKAQRIKALGNAIVPEVAQEIMRAIKESV